MSPQASSPVTVMLKKLLSMLCSCRSSWAATAIHLFMEVVTIQGTHFIQTLEMVRDCTKSNNYHSSPEGFHRGFETDCSVSCNKNSRIYDLIHRRSWPATAGLVTYISFSFLTRTAINSTVPHSYSECKQYTTSKIEILWQNFLHVSIETVIMKENDVYKKRR